MSKPSTPNYKTITKRSNQEHNDSVPAKDVIAHGYNAGLAQHLALNVDANGNLNVVVVNNTTKPNGISYNDNSFAAGDSPIVLDLQADLGRLASDITIANTGDETIDVELSYDGSTYDTQVRLPARGTINRNRILVSKIRLTHTGDDSAYFVMAH